MTTISRINLSYIREADDANEKAYRLALAAYTYFAEASEAASSRWGSDERRKLWLLSNEADALKCHFGDICDETNWLAA